MSIKAARLLLASSLLAALACVEQDHDKPSSTDLAAAKQNLLSAAPTPRYPVNADLDGKVIFIGLDADPLQIGRAHV